MADFRKWILALAVVALLAGLSMPASAQTVNAGPLTCQSSVTTTPIVRAEGLAELVGDLLVYCTGGTPTAPGQPVPQYTVTVFLNTNITSKVLGTQLASFGNGQTSALDEALLIIDEPNSSNSPGVQCGAAGAYKLTGCVAGVSLGTAYPVLNCGAVVGGLPAAPDGGQSGPGVCEIIATHGATATAPAPEHTYDGTVAGGFYSGATFPDACGTNIASITTGSITVTATITAASATIVFPAGVSQQMVGLTVTGIGVGATASVSGTATIMAVTNATTATLSAAAAGPTATETVTVSGVLQGNLTAGSNQVTLDLPGSSTWVNGKISDGFGLIAPNTTITGVSGSTLILSNTLGFTSAGTAAAGDLITIVTTGTVGAVGALGSPGYACGRPNVFQGRIGALQNPNQYNAVTFVGVPLDPPGTAIGRTLRITNIRANAAQLGVSSTFTTSQILMNLAVNNGPVAGWNIGNPQQIVAYVNKGLNPVAAFAPATSLYCSQLANGCGSNYLANGLNQSGTGGNLAITGGSTLSGLAGAVPVIGEYVQCISQNPDLFSATPAPSFTTPGYLGHNPSTDSGAVNYPGGFNCNGPGGDCLIGATGVSANVTPTIRFSEGFASSWKYQNISFAVGDGTGAFNGNATYGTGAVVNGFTCQIGDYCYNGKVNHPLNIPQNVPGSSYNTESGFAYPGAPSSTPLTYGPVPTPNPPTGFGTAAAGSSTNGNPLSDDWKSTANATGIQNAGLASQSTRLYLSFNSIPNGSSLWVPPIIYLFRQGVVHNGDPATLGTNPLNGQAQSQTTGVMELVTTDGSGNNIGPWATVTTINPFQLQKVGSSGLVVYEILYTDPYSVEYADVPVVVAYASNPAQNLPDPTATAQVTGGFAPFYTSSASTQPSPNATFQSPTLPVPRFIPGTAFNFLNVQKCACNILFPFVSNQIGYDTGIAIANSSLDPGSTFGFKGVPQPGTVEFWYYGAMANGAAVPGPQSSSVVQPGQVLTYSLSSGSSTYGLDGRGAGFQGYIITQAQFQYCHAFAYISAQGAGPTSPGASEGYLGIVLDAGGLQRTSSIGENDAH